MACPPSRLNPCPSLEVEASAQVGVQVDTVALRTHGTAPLNFGRARKHIRSPFIQSMFYPITICIPYNLTGNMKI